MESAPLDGESQGILAAGKKIDLSPDEDLRLAGNGGQEFGRLVGEVLEANLAAFIIGNTKLLWISLDTLYVGELFITEFHDAIGDLPGWSISFFATHTHNAPALDISKPQLGEASIEWVSRTARLVAGGVLDLLNANFEDGLGSVAAFDLAGGISRRVLQPISVSRQGLHFWKVVSGINPREQIDARCNIFLVANSRDNRPVFAVINWPCHPVGEPKGYGYSPSFPGVLRSSLAQFLDYPDLPVLFLQGFSAEIRPDSAETNLPRRRGSMAQVFGPGYSNFSEAGLKKWRHELATRFLGVLTAARWERLSFDRTYCRESELDLSKIFPGIARRRLARVLLIRLSANLVILAISGEIPSSCSLRVRAILGNETVVITAGCYGDTVGYIPTARFRREKGYEGFGFAAAFGLPGPSRKSGEYFDLLIEDLAFELKGLVP